MQNIKNKVSTTLDNLQPAVAATMICLLLFYLFFFIERECM